ncbi:MAG: GDSL-type esterase/lipase family protein [Ginsengibacter sp.]
MQNAMRSKLQFTSIEKNRVSIDSMYYYQFNAIDSSGNTFSFSVEGLPSWLIFNAEDHSLSGKPVKPGQYMIHIAASTTDTTVHQRFMLTVYNSKTMNILTLGNSITNGTNKYDSYRRSLWQMLHKGNYNFDLIGSWTLHHMGGEVPDPDFDMDHDGHSGWKASDILSQPDWDQQRGNIHEWIRAYSPDIVLIELGTNEVFQCIAVKDAMDNISSIIDILGKKNPHVKIFVARIPPLGAQWADKKLCGNDITYGKAVINFNRQVAVLVAAKNTDASRVILVDQYSGVNAAADMYDDIHPNETGEKKMAEKWYKAINKYLTKLKN